jgi:hypothetical protein
MLYSGSDERRQPRNSVRVDHRPLSQNSLVKARMNEISSAPQDDPQAVARAKSRSWSTFVPALRLTRPTPRPAATPPPASGEPVVMPLAPRYLRPLRALVGLGLLALAWLGLVAVAGMGMDAWTSLPRQHLTPHVLVTLLMLALACWVAFVAIGCLVLGAFCLTLAITSRGWQ